VAPKVSLLVPIWRLQATYFEKCLQSLVRQDYPAGSVEVSVCLDGTPSREASTIESELRQSGLNYVLTVLPNRQGIANARNACADSATGDWLVLVDHDDWLHKDAVRALVDRAGPGIDLVYSNYEQVEPTGRIIFRSRVAAYHRLLIAKGRSWDSPLLHSTFILQAIMIRAGAFRAAGGFDASAGLAHEVDLRTRMFFGDNFECVGRALYCYVKRTNSTYHTRYKELVQDTCRVMLRHFRKYRPDASTCRRLGKVAPFRVTHYGFYDQEGSLIPIEWADYRDMMLRTPF